MHSTAMKIRNLQTSLDMNIGVSLGLKNNT